MKIAINGFGRIGRAFFRIAFNQPNLEIVAINDLGEVDNFAYLLQYDTVYGKYDKHVNVKKEAGQNKLVIEGKEILYFCEKDPSKLPWKDLKIDAVVEATGVFADYVLAKSHIAAGAKKVLITAPATGGEGKDGKTSLLGINEDDLNKFEIISDGSCTTNAVSPVMAVLNEKLGVKKAILNTVHAYTATQSLVDGPVNKDWLRGRAAAQNISPSTTGAAKTVAKALPSLEGKFDGLALRVPVVCGSVADITFVSEKPTAIEEVNNILKTASQEPRWKNILAVSDIPLVSSDIIKDPRPSVVDLTFTNVIDGDLVKVLAWYDNEWGYAWTLVEQIKKFKI